MKAKGLLVMGTIALLSALAIACGSGGDTEAPADGEGGAAGITPAGGAMIAPGQYLTFEGRRYELVNLLFEDMVSGEFEAVGEVSQSDVDVAGDQRVFRRAGDETSVYTYTASNAEDPAYWLAWNLVP